MEVTANAWAVDAACSGNPGPMEYQAIDLATGAQVFHFGPMHGTNNIGEFLAIVHALALLDKQGIEGKTIYSDSHNAILWVQKRQCKTKLERTPQTEQLYQIMLYAIYFIYGLCVMFYFMMSWLFYRKDKKLLSRLVAVMMFVIGLQCLKDLFFIKPLTELDELDWMVITAADMIVVPLYVFVLIELCSPATLGRRTIILH